MNYHLNHNLAGDRTIEYEFVLNAIPRGNGQALDFGSGGVPTLIHGLQAAGWHVTTIDRDINAEVPGVGAIREDILDSDLSLPKFQLILCCSAIEHVGLAGRYGTIIDDPEGDLKAMRVLHEALTDGGRLILTLPVGIDHVHYPMHRVYGKRLKALLDGFNVVRKQFWRKRDGQWAACSEKEALSTVSISVSTTDWQGSLYALGGYILEKPL